MFNRVLFIIIKKRSSQGSIYLQFNVLSACIRFFHGGDGLRPVELESWSSKLLADTRREFGPVFSFDPFCCATIFSFLRRFWNILKYIHGFLVQTQYSIPTKNPKLSSHNFYYSSAKAFQKLPLLCFVLYSVHCRDYCIKMGRANAGKTRNRKKSE